MLAVRRIARERENREWLTGREVSDRLPGSP